MNDPSIIMAHGGGGSKTNRLIHSLFLQYFTNPFLDPMHDAALLPCEGTRIAMTTDSFVVKPLNFPGGNIGELAVCGTVNDLAVMGAIPKYLTCGFIIEEGLSLKELETQVKSMASSAQAAHVSIVSGDTKVVEKGHGDGLYINTTGLGYFTGECTWQPERIELGDHVIVSGNLGEHALAIFCLREGIPLQTPIQSDVAPLNNLLASLHEFGIKIKAVRDITRGGLGNILHEMVEHNRLGVKITESNLPISTEVRNISDIVGMDPLYLANEGKVILFVDPGITNKVLETLHNHTLGNNACCIGEVIERPKGTVIMRTNLDTHRVIPMLSGEQLPRIC